MYRILCIILLCGCGIDTNPTQHKKCTPEQMEMVKDFMVPCKDSNFNGSCFSRGVMMYCDDKPN